MLIYNVKLYCARQRIQKKATNSVLTGNLSIWCLACRDPCPLSFISVALETVLTSVEQGGWGGGLLSCVISKHRQRQSLWYPSETEFIWPLHPLIKEYKLHHIPTWSSSLSSAKWCRSEWHQGDIFTAPSDDICVQCWLSCGDGWKTSEWDIFHTFSNHVSSITHISGDIIVISHTVRTDWHSAAKLWMTSGAKTQNIL